MSDDAWIAIRFLHLLAMAFFVVALATVLVGLHLRFGQAHFLQSAVFLVSLAIVWAGISLSH